MRSDRSRSALAAAVAVAGEFGLAEVEPVVLRDRANLLVWLRPAPVVARVATVTGLARSAGVAANLARDLSIAGYLVEAGAPAVPPSTELPPGPHVRDGHTLTFWQYVEHEPDHVLRPAEFAALLAELHPVLAGYPGDLPLLPPFDLGILDHLPIPPADRDSLLAEAANLIEELRGADVPVQALHGDAHPGNVLWTPDGPVWNDFEDAWRGPVAWDLACMARTGRLDGIAALAGYPGSPTVADLGVCFAARRLQGRLWTMLMEFVMGERL